MSNNSTVTKAQQSQNTQNVADKAKLDKVKTEANIQDKQKFERMARLWELYNKVGKKEETEVVAGPMDILREFGQFLVDISNKDTENVVCVDSMLNMEYSLQMEHTEAVQAPKQIDVDALERLAERILASLPTDNTPQVQIKVADNILPDTNITVQNIDGVLSVQIDSNNADAIVLLGHQGAALQQMLEAKMGESVIVELNSERMQTNDDAEQQKNKGQQQNQEEHSDIE